MKHPWPSFKWRPLDPETEQRLSDVLELWRGTPYSENAYAPQVGVSCARFVCAIGDHMFRRPPTGLRFIPSDQSLHAPDSARAAMRLLMRRYGARRVKDGFLEPGDIPVSGPLDGGPGHAQIVGTSPNRIWQAAAPHVWPTGFGPQPGAEVFFGVLRVPKANWK